MEAKEQEIIENTAKELFSHLGIESTFELTPLDEGVDLTLATEDSGIIIGYHGEVLEALQLITSLAVSKKIGKFVRVSIEVGDYKKNRSSYLEHLALEAKEKAIEEQSEVPLPSLKSWERRIVHMILQNDDEVESESKGEGRDRTLVIRPRSSH